ncbi:SH2 domain-containing adapter protein F isoform X2 [Xenopus tropicalis]|uniref:SH2 domain-containing adapter protein F isoform X2 n=1 Tax=Xenopus tropicalis TaxID=8364 RepID=A0A8J0SV68_XENTR|nr:SH2 domain-containing adapter protein F isoform X2 [Xenopus tropicalis]
MLLGGHSSASAPASPQPAAEPIRSSSRGSPPAAASTGQQCAGSMAKWIKEHLGFKSSKPPPPAPPKPDYRLCQAGGASTHHHHHHHLHSAVPQFPVTPAGQPDILAAYKLQKERDFEDPYTTCGAPGASAQLNSSTVPPSAPTSSSAQSPSSPSHSPDVKYVSPKHRLIKVDTGEKGSCSPTGGNTAGSSGSPGQAFTSPSVPSPGVRSPPATAVAPQLEESKQDKVAIVEDYADPFDAKQVPGSQNAPEKVTENDGYMEPYEAQKMMAEIRRRGSKELPCTPLHLYDTPYEPSENGLDSEGEKSTSQRPRESRLPQDDERPPEEYDQPWEWKKERISKAFAVGQLNSRTASAENDLSTSFSQQTPTSPHFQRQASLEDSNAQFDSADKTGMAAAKEDKPRHMHRHSAGNLKAIKHPSVEHCISVGERIDPSLPLESQFWYHGAISRADAESLLRLCKEASYLVRNSETNKIDFSLSLKSIQGFMHMKLSRTKENKYVLGHNSPPFNSVPEIIHHYASQKLPIKGAEHMSLLYPVAVRTL